MTNRLTLFKWTVKDQKEELNVIEHPFETTEEAIKFLDGLPEGNYDIAKIFLGDSLVHMRDTKTHIGENFS